MYCVILYCLVSSRLTELPPSRNTCNLPFAVLPIADIVCSPGLTSASPTYSSLIKIILSLGRRLETGISGCVAGSDCAANPEPALPVGACAGAAGCCPAAGCTCAGLCATTPTLVCPNSTCFWPFLYRIIIGRLFGRIKGESTKATSSFVTWFLSAETLISPMGLFILLKESSLAKV